MCPRVSCGRVGAWGSCRQQSHPPPPAVIPAKAGTQYSPDLRPLQRTRRVLTAYWASTCVGVTVRGWGGLGGDCVTLLLFPRPFPLPLGPWRGYAFGTKGKRNSDDPA